MTRHTTPDLLDLAEAVAAGRMTRAEADAAIRLAGGRGVDDRLAELDALVRAVAAVERDAAVRRRASADASGGVVAGAVAGAGARAGAGAAAEVAVGGSPVGPVRGSTVRATRGPGDALAGLAVAGAAVLVVGAFLVGAVRIPSSGGPQPVPASPATWVTADPAIPSILDGRLEGAPRAAFWSLVSSDRVAVWTWRSGEALTKLAEVDAWADPAGTPPGGLGSVQRTLLVSPDGERFAFAETTGSGILRGRLRVFDAGGRLAWELGGEGADGVGSMPPLAFAWAPDGRSLAVESGSWDLVTFDDGGGATSRRLDATIPGESGYALIGFSADGSRLYGWETGGEAEWWQRPVAVDVSSGALSTLTGFPADALAGVGASNATFPLDRIAGGSGAALVQPLLAKGDAAWAAIRGGMPVPIATSAHPEDADPRWGPDGRVVVVSRRAAAGPPEVADPRAAAGPPEVADPPEVAAGSVSIVAPGATGTSRDLFVFAPGAYDIATGGVSGDYVLCLAAAPHGAVGGSALGYDEAVLIRISDGTTSVGLAPDRSADGAGVTFAGWLSGQ